MYREGGPGASARLICGFLACDPQRSRAFLGGLPSIVRINIREDDPGRWLEGTLRRSVDEGALGVAAAFVLAAFQEELALSRRAGYVPQSFEDLDYHMV